MPRKRKAPGLPTLQRRAADLQNLLVRCFRGKPDYELLHRTAKLLCIPGVVGRNLINQALKNALRGQLILSAYRPHRTKQAFNLSWKVDPKALSILSNTWFLSDGHKDAIPHPAPYYPSTGTSLIATGDPAALQWIGANLEAFDTLITFPGGSIPEEEIHQLMEELNFKNRAINPPEVGDNVQRFFAHLTGDDSEIQARLAVEAPDLLKYVDMIPDDQLAPVWIQLVLPAVTTQNKDKPILAEYARLADQVWDHMFQDIDRYTSTLTKKLLVTFSTAYHLIPQDMLNPLWQAYVRNCNQDQRSALRESWYRDPVDYLPIKDLLGPLTQPPDWLSTNDWDSIRSNSAHTPWASSDLLISAYRRGMLVPGDNLITMTRVLQPRYQPQLIELCLAYLEQGGTLDYLHPTATGVTSLSTCMPEALTNSIRELWDLRSSRAAVLASIPDETAPATIALDLV